MTDENAAEQAWLKYRNEQMRFEDPRRVGRRIRRREFIAGYLAATPSCVTGRAACVFTEGPEGGTP